MVNNVEDEQEISEDWEDPADEAGDDIPLCNLAVTCGGEWQTVRRTSRRTSWTPQECRPCAIRGAHIHGGMFGLLTGDDEDNNTELLNVDDKVDKDGWRKIVAVVDSGAGENVIPKNLIDFVPIMATARSMSGKGFQGAGGEHIANHGEQQISFRTKEGQVRKTTWQVADVRRPLMSVSKMAAAGNEVVLNGKDPRVTNLRTKEVTQIRREGNVYVLDLWVQVPRHRDLSGAMAPQAATASGVKSPCVKFHSAMPGGRRAAWNQRRMEDSMDVGVVDLSMKPSHKTSGFARPA